MRSRTILIAIVALAAAPWAVAAERTSTGNPRLKAYLETHPEADADKDGILTFSEAKAHFAKARTKKAQAPKGALSYPKGKGLRILSTGHSWVAPALKTLPSIAKAAGLDGHRQRSHISGGGTGSANSIWLKEHGKYNRAPAKIVLLPAIATGQWDVMTWGIYTKDRAEYFSQWIDVCLEDNPKMVFYIQDAWPSISRHHKQYKSEADVPLDALLAIAKGSNARLASLVEVLEAKYPGKVRIIPAANAMCEVLKLYFAKKLPGIEGLSKHLSRKPNSIWSDGGHLSPNMAWWEGYVYYATLYKKSPALIDAPIPGNRIDAELDKRLRACAWKAVVNHPLSGVTDKNANGIGDEIEGAPRP